MDILIGIFLLLIIVIGIALYRDFVNAPIWDEDSEKWITEEEYEEMKNKNEETLSDYLDKK